MSVIVSHNSPAYDRICYVCCSCYVTLCTCGGGFGTEMLVSCQMPSVVRTTYNRVRVGVRVYRTVNNNGWGGRRIDRQHDLQLDMVGVRGVTLKVKTRENKVGLRQDPDRGL